MIHCYDNFINSIGKSMIQGNTTTYIKKLVKIVYEKEKQI